MNAKQAIELMDQLDAKMEKLTAESLPLIELFNTGDHSRVDELMEIIRQQNEINLDKESIKNRFCK